MIEKLLKKFLDEQALLKEAMANGTPQNYKAYRELVGRYQQLESDIATVKQLYRESEED